MPIDARSGARRAEDVEDDRVLEGLGTWDPPTTGLDESAFQRHWARVEQLRRDEGLTVLLTTHRPEEAERCDRLAVIDRGRVVACDTPAALRARVSGDVFLPS